MNILICKNCGTSANYIELHNTKALDVEFSVKENTKFVIVYDANIGEDFYLCRKCFEKTKVNVPTILDTLD